MAALLCFAACSVPVYKSLTNPGWEHRVPSWWLAEVEVRFSSGARFDQAYRGLMFGKQERRFSKVWYERAEVVGFNRFAALGPGASNMGSLHQLAINAADDGLIPEDQVVRAIRATTSPGAASVATTSMTWGDAAPLNVQCAFIPNEWFVQYEVTLEDSQQNAGDPIRSAHGFISRSRSERSTDWGFNPESSHPVQCVWHIRIGRETSADKPLVRWEVRKDLILIKPAPAR